MAKHEVAEQESLGEAMNKTELFFEKNGRKITYILLALLVLGGLIFGYRALISQPRAEKAATMMASAQAQLESQTPDFSVALNGDEKAAGFLQVIDQFGSTPSGNLAKHYAGICYLRLGDLKNAAKYLAQYSTVSGIPGAIVNAENYGLQGDVAVEEKEYAKAVSFYEKAINEVEDSMLVPIYLYKAGLAQMAQGNKEEAQKAFREIINNYPEMMQLREQAVEKLASLGE